MNIWEKIAERYAYKGWRSILVKTFRFPDGQDRHYDIIENSPYVVVAAFTTNRDAILVRQYRPGPEQLVSSFCEGYIDKDEQAQEAAARELLEETGYQAGDLRYLRTIRTAYSTEERICFLATNCEYAQVPSGDIDEFIDVFTMPWADFLAFAADTNSDFASQDITFLVTQAMV